MLRFDPTSDPPAIPPVMLTKMFTEALEAIEGVVHLTPRSRM